MFLVLPSSQFDRCKSDTDITANLAMAFERLG
jgi:hypothetical protein